MSSSTLPTPTRAPAVLVPASRPCPSAAPPGTLRARALGPGPGPAWGASPHSARAGGEPEGRPLRTVVRVPGGAVVRSGRIYFFKKQSTFRRFFPPGMFAGNPAGGSFMSVFGAGVMLGCRV